MTEILEIRDGCSTSLELLQSEAFNKFLILYKKQFVRELESREEGDQKEEVIHKKYFVDSIVPSDFIKILELNKELSNENLPKNKEYVRFIDGLFHYYRKKSYTRLIKLHDEILSSKEKAESIKDRISKRAYKLNDLIELCKKLQVSIPEKAKKQILYNELTKIICV